MRNFLVKIRKKIFATYEYNDHFNEVSERLSSLNESLKNLANGVDNLNVGMDNSSFNCGRLTDKMDFFERKIEELNNKLESNVSSVNGLRIDLDVNESKINLISRGDFKKGKKKIVFLVHNLNAWHSISKLIYELKKEDNYSIIIASINKRFPGQSDFSGEDDVHDFLDGLSINHIRLGMHDSYQALDILISINPDVIFRQSQWDVDFPPGLSSRRLNFSKLAIIPYEITSIVETVIYDGDIKDPTTDSLFHRRCWKVYCSSEYVKYNAMQNGRMNAFQFVVSGHPKIDYLTNIKPNWPFREKNVKRVLWSPHHSIGKGWSDFGLFPMIWRDMITLSDKYQDIDFVFCPHPALVTQLKYGSIIEDGFDYESFIDTWNSKDNNFLYFGADYANLAASCDIVLTDGLSMLMECQFFKKNIIFIERDGHVPFNNIGEKLKSGFFSVQDVFQAENLILDLLAGKVKSLCNEQVINTEEIFPCRNAVDNIIMDLKESI